MKILPVDDAVIEDEVVAVDSVKIQYIQSADCVSDRDEFQYLDIFTENNGTARFIVLKTKRWAISDIDEFIRVLKDFKIRAGLKNEEKSEF